MGLIHSTAGDQVGALPVSSGTLESADPEIRRRGALDVGGHLEAVPALLGHLADEPDLAARDAILTVLAAHDTEAVAGAMIDFLASENAGLRNAVADALATMPHGLPPLLPRLTTSPDPDVRVLVAMMLGILAHPGVVPALVGMVSADSDANVVGAALDSLLPLATGTHIALLERTLARFPEDPFLDFTIRSAIPRLASDTT
jgi:HEAT repeat protein